jgi:hypothetical protein
MTPISEPTDLERSLMCWLAIQTLAAQTGCTEETAVDVLERITATGDMKVYWDDADVWLSAYGHPLVHADRDWLAMTALSGAPPPDDLSGLTDPPPWEA